METQYSSQSNFCAVEATSPVSPLHNLYGFSVHSKLGGGHGPYGGGYDGGHGPYGGGYGNYRY